MVRGTSVYRVTESVLVVVDSEFLPDEISEGAVEEAHLCARVGHGVETLESEPGHLHELDFGHANAVDVRAHHAGVKLLGVGQEHDHGVDKVEAPKHVAVAGDVQGNHGSDDENRGGKGI